MQWAAGILREVYRNWFVAGHLFRPLAAFEENLIRVLTNICRKMVKENKMDLWEVQNRGVCHVKPKVWTTQDKWLHLTQNQMQSATFKVTSQN